MILIKNLFLNKKSFILGAFMLWGLFGMFAALSSDTAHHIDQITNIISIIIKVGILILSFRLFQSTSDTCEKNILFWFFTACTWYLITEINFYFYTYVHILTAFDMPFHVVLLWCTFTLLCWVAFTVFLLKILIPRILSKQSFLKIFYVLIIFNIPVIGLFMVSMNHGNFFSAVYIADNLMIVCKLLLFDILIICIICVENVAMLLLLSGIAITVGASTFFNYYDFAHSSFTLLYPNLLWVLGSLLILLSLIFLNTNHPKGFIQSSFRKFNSIKSQLALWTFSISILGFLIFFIIAYEFSLIHKEVFGALPFFIMVYSVIIALLSLLIGKTVESSFKKIINNISSVMEAKRQGCVNNTFYIEEFTVLQKFIMHVIEIYNERDDARKKLREISDQVVHDIRSPLSALHILTEQQLPELEESKRIMLRNAVCQIGDIVNNLNQNALTQNADIQIAILLEQVISERRTALSEKSITIHQNFDVHAYKLFIYASASELKRVLTNLINNSAEAMQSNNGIVNVVLNSDHDKINIIITDNGAGIPAEKIPSLFARGFTTKTTGSGLGLFYAREVITKCSGEILLQSIINEGTTITIKIPALTPPIWFATQLILPKNSIAICVDDSISILNVWQERLKPFTQDIELRYCRNKADLLLELNHIDHQPKTFLVDYEFSGQSYTGHELIKKIFDHQKPHDQILLVTSRSDEIIQKFCLDNNIKIISKFFAVKIPVVIRESL